MIMLKMKPVLKSIEQYWIICPLKTQIKISKEKKKDCIYQDMSRFSCIIFLDANSQVASLRLSRWKNRWLLRKIYKTNTIKKLPNHQLLLEMFTHTYTKLIKHPTNSIGEVGRMTRKPGLLPAFPGQGRYFLKYS